MSDRYYGDPNRMQNGIDELTEIAEFTKGITAEFLDQIIGTSSWPGEDDEYAKKMKPQERKERQNAKETLQSIRDAIVGITEGTQQNVDTMERIRDDSLEEINQAAKTVQGRDVLRTP